MPPGITAAYMDVVNPKNEEIIFSSDIWSLGLTLPLRACHLLAKNKPIFHKLVQCNAK